MGDFIGYFFGVSRNKASTVFYDAAHRNVRIPRACQGGRRFPNRHGEGCRKARPHAVGLVFPVCVMKLVLPMVPKRRGSGMRGEGSKEERG